MFAAIYCHFCIRASGSVCVRMFIWLAIPTVDGHKNQSKRIRTTKTNNDDTGAPLTTAQIKMGAKMVLSRREITTLWTENTIVVYSCWHIYHRLVR